MNIREISKIDLNYFEINREERNYAAIFFTALCKPNNSEAFLKFCGFNYKDNTDFGIYFEYAYLRDLWNNIHDENIKKEIIRQKLNISKIDEILTLPIEEINKKFGVGGEASGKFIQFPGKWAIIKYDEHFPNNDDFIKICRFKWSFNIKPDIVIHLDRNNAVCIEAKYESSEGFYPSSEIEKEIFRKRGLKYIGQMELQKYMMENLLGVKTDFLFLVSKEKKSETHKLISWAKAFTSIDLSEMPKFAIEMVKNISKNR